MNVIIHHVLPPTRRVMSFCSYVKDIHIQEDLCLMTFDYSTKLTEKFVNAYLETSANIHFKKYTKNWMVKGNAK